MDRINEQHLFYLQDKARKSGLQADLDEFNNAAHEYNRQWLKQHPQNGLPSGWSADKALRRLI